MLLKISLALLFFVFFLTGMELSSRKALWNDELYTQVRTSQNVSYGKIISGFIEEGGNAPLFYLLQKGILDLTNYRLDINWEGLKTGRLLDDRSQFLLRLLPNVCISAALVLIFYFFLTRFSIWAALLSLFISLTNYMLLIHWVEARPYPMYFLWGVMQIFLLFKSQEQKDNSRVIPYFFVVHTLIALTLSTATGLILIAGFILYLQGVRSFKKHFFITVLPLMIAVYYACITSLMSYTFPYKISSMKELWHEGFGLDWILFIIISVIMLTVSFLKELRSFFLRNYVLWAMLGVCIYTVVVMALLKSREFLIPTDNLIDLNSRFFIYLGPWAIFIPAIFIIKIFRFLWGRRDIIGPWVWQYCLFSVCFLIVHVVMVFKKIYSISMYAY